MVRLSQGTRTHALQKKHDLKTYLSALNTSSKSNPLFEEFSRNFQKMLEAAQEGNTAAVSRLMKTCVACNLFMLTSRLRIYISGDVILENMALFEMYLKIGSVKELYKRKLIKQSEMEAVIERIKEKYKGVLSYEERCGLL